MNETDSADQSSRYIAAHWVVILAAFPGTLLVSMATYWIASLFSEGEDLLGIALYPLMLWGVTIWIFTLPMYFWYRNKHAWKSAQHILLGSGLAFLVSTGCFGLMWVLSL